MSLVIVCDFKGCNAAKVVGSPSATERDDFARTNGGWTTLSDRGMGMGTSFHFCPEHGRLLMRDQWPLDASMVAAIVKNAG